MNANEAKKFALIALGLFIISEVVFVVLSIIQRGQPIPQIDLANAVTTLLIRWIPPLVVVYQVEKRNAEALGLVIRQEQRLTYAILVAMFLAVPAFFVGFDKPLLVEFGEQVVYIGLLEEFFYRGYLMNRLCEWLGNGKGLFWSCFIFGLGHVIARIADHGFGIFDQALIAGGQSFLGGLIFGLIYLRAKKIWPGAILHVATNMYLSRLIEVFGS
jgi:membrane protease YdiL (CAAX protease family)